MVSPAPSRHGELSVAVRDVPAQDYLGKRFSSELASIGPRVQEAFIEVYACIGKANATPGGPPFLIA